MPVLKWQLRGEPVAGGDWCQIVIEHEGGDWIDVSDARDVSEAGVKRLHELLADANAAEVYRKALEPFAREFVALGALNEWIDLGPQQYDVAALREACRLMGFPLDDEEPDEK